MIIVMAVRRALGFVRFEAEGVFCEKFMNLAMKSGVDIRGPLKSGVTLRGWVLARDYKKLRLPAKKAGVRLHIIKRKGLPFWVRRHRGRAGLAAGMVLSVLALFVMSRFVWEVRVAGADSTDAAFIMEIAEAKGLKAGTLRKRHDVRKIESAILIGVKELSWVTVNIEGCIANIVVKESTPIPEMRHDDDVPTNVVAARTGIIRSMEVYDGSAVLKAGDTVLKGGLLVSGIIEDEYNKLTLKHARAKVMAETEYEIIVRFPLEQALTRRSGKAINHRTLDFFGAKIPLWTGKYSGEAEKEVETSRLRLLWLPLQISVENERIYPVEKRSVLYSEEQAKGGAFQILERRRADELGDAQILSEKLTGELHSGEYVLTAKYRCVMDIAEGQPLLSDTPWDNTDSWS